MIGRNNVDIRFDPSDKEQPRKICYWVDSPQALSSRMQNSQAFAYLPGCALCECGLIRIDVSGSAFHGGGLIRE